MDLAHGQPERRGAGLGLPSGPTNAGQYRLQLNSVIPGVSCRGTLGHLVLPGPLVLIPHSVCRAAGEPPLILSLRLGAAEAACALQQSLCQCQCLSDSECDSLARSYQQRVTLTAFVPGWALLLRVRRRRRGGDCLGGRLGHKRAKYVVYYRKHH